MSQSTASVLPPPDQFTQQAFYLERMARAGEQAMERARNELYDCRQDLQQIIDLPKSERWRTSCLHVIDHMTNQGRDGIELLAICRGENPRGDGPSRLERSRWLGAATKARSALYSHPSPAQGAQAMKMHIPPMLQQSRWIESQIDTILENSVANRDSRAMGRPQEANQPAGPDSGKSGKSGKSN